ncbi:cytidine deaminase-like protein [Aureobasidium pullulans]|uniref:Cytidine deaminase-like protein n=1 Tax=Aureobasidium pullulans TaxID=5580 RepID=A0A4S8W1S9_AURPU|nr:cytidine deaminase-like protein [Aureobasidium pullulans]
MSEEQRGRSAPPGVGPDFSPAGSEAEAEADLDGRNSPSSFIDDNDMPPTKPGLWLLKTKAEARASTATVQAWTIELPSRAANTVLGLIKDNVPELDAIDLQHIRRFAKARFLPTHLIPETVAVSRSRSASERDGSSRGSSRSRSSRNKRRGSIPATLHLIVSPVHCIGEDALTELLLANPPFAEDGFPLILREVTLPLLPPTSAEQAELWSQQYWPTIYRKTNPFGPHPSIIGRAEEEVTANNNVPRLMEMAKKVAGETKAKCCGAGVGCVIIERPTGKPIEVIAVAGDGRHQGFDEVAGQQNPMAHAVMRAIGMVARKRVRSATRDPTKLNQDMAALDINRPSHTPAVGAPKFVDKTLLDYPLTPMERKAFNKDNLIPDGYLCVDLEIYLTHEPCVMCTMAILHSRFARCVFGIRMPKTGALTADGGGLGYGLFWRPELNWKFLCWEWKEKDPYDGDNHLHLFLDKKTQV